MNARQMIASGAMALLLAPAAFASSATASTNAPASCKTLETRFDKDVLSSHAADISKARQLRAEGGSLCTQGKHTEGVKKLEDAVKMLGASPVHN
jgi:hypothetical protein